MYTTFINWSIEKMQTDDWSIDAYVGHAKLLKLFSTDEMICTKQYTMPFGLDSSPSRQRISLPHSNVNREPKVGYGRIYDKFAEVFKAITVDNDSVLSTFASLSVWGTKVYYAHPYSSWEKPQNERSKGLYQRYAPKG